MNPPYTTVLSAAEVAAHLTDPDWVIVDCRFDLLDTAAGERRYRQSHIPGAVYAHLDRDLSGAKTSTGEGGRHPLPAPADLTRTFGGWGIGDAASGRGVSASPSRPSSSPLSATAMTVRPRASSASRAAASGASLAP